MKEIWKDIKNFEGLYQVSNLGRVKSLPKYTYSRGYSQLRKEKLLKPCYVGKYRNYLAVRLNNNKQYKIHRLVAKAFIPNPNNYPCVNHKDKNPSNNNVENLEWCTNQYNVKYSAKPLSIIHKSKLSKVHLGRIWINNGYISKLIYPNEFENFNKLGYTLGRIYKRSSMNDKSPENNLKIN